MLSITPRTQIKKGAHKAVFDRNQLDKIIDESLIAHIAIDDGQGPIVIPMLAWRVDNYIYIHGANNSRLMRYLGKSYQTCLTFTLFDGWVLAKSAFHHSAHYRSAAVLGKFELVGDNVEKDRLLNHFLEQIAPGRIHDVRPSSQRELAATTLLKMPLTEVSVKISCHGVRDEEYDLDRPVWAGVLPYKTVVGPLQSADSSSDITEPDYSTAYGERWFSNQ